MKHLDTLHELYCSAAAVAERHIGRDDERHFWAIADAAWDKYQKAKTDAELAAIEADYRDTVDGFLAGTGRV